MLSNTLEVCVICTIISLIKVLFCKNVDQKVAQWCTCSAETDHYH